MDQTNSNTPIKVYPVKYTKADGTVQTYQRVFRYTYQKKNPTKMKAAKLKTELRQRLLSNPYTYEQLKKIEKLLDDMPPPIESFENND